MHFQTYGKAAISYLLFEFSLLETIEWLNQSNIIKN